MSGLFYGDSFICLTSDVLCCSHIAGIVTVIGTKTADDVAVVETGTADEIGTGVEVEAVNAGGGPVLGNACDLAAEEEEAVEVEVGVEEEEEGADGGGASLGVHWGSH